MARLNGAFDLNVRLEEDDDDDFDLNNEDDGGFDCNEPVVLEVNTPSSTMDPWRSADGDELDRGAWETAGD
ncbi:unnamed protein product [Urochloa humidicola]